MSLHWDDIPSISKTYPPGACVEDNNASTNILRLALWWISHLILQYLHTTSFNSAMGLPNRYPLPKCHLSFLNHLPIHLIPATFCLRSYISTPKSCTNMTVSTTRVTYWSHKMEHTTSATNHMSTRKSKTGAYHSQTSLQIGMNYAQKVCYFLAMYPRPFFDLCNIPLAWTLPLILSALPTLFETIHITNCSRPLRWWLCILLSGPRSQREISMHPKGIGYNNYC